MDEVGSGVATGEPDQRASARRGAVGRPEAAEGEEEDAPALPGEVGGVRAGRARSEVGDPAGALARAVAAPRLAVLEGAGKGRGAQPTKKRVLPSGPTTGCEGPGPSEPSRTPSG
jgi:hypothetical protein